ncbi:hypothetical protein N9L54_06790 [Porticoccaceae bacterium]|nr:hypothetical protein [Porticoccaceae bacterium]
MQPLSNLMKKLNPDTFVDAVVSSTWMLLDLLTKNPRTLIDLEYTANEHTLGLKNYSMVSFVNLDGLSGLVEGGSESLENHWVDFLGGWLGQNSPHEFIVSFESDPEGVESYLDHMMNPVRAQCDRMGLDINDIIDEKVNVLTKFCRMEKTTFALLTQRYSDSAFEQKQSAIEEREILENSLRSFDGMPDSPLSDSLLDKHAQFVNAFVQFLHDRRYFAQKVDVESIVKHLHGELYGHQSAPLSVDTSLNNTQIRSVDRGLSADDDRAFVPQSFAEQILSGPVDNAGQRYAIFGHRIVAPIKVSRFPTKDVKFSQFIERLQDTDVPYRVTLNIKSGGLDYNYLSNTMAKGGWWLSPWNNNPIKKALDQMQDYVFNKNGVVVGVSMMISTWATLNSHVNINDTSKEIIDFAEIQSRVTTLLARVKRWGGLRADNALMDPVEACLFSTSGLKQGHFADVTPVPLPDCVTFLPLERPTMPWKQGTVLFRSPDGKVMPLEVMSTLQTAMLTLVYGPPGYGKSVAIGELNLDFIIKPRASGDLPLLRMIDVGPSGGGVINLLRGGLPKTDLHKAQHRTIKNTSDYCVNNFDTWLCERHPVSSQKTSLLNFLVSVCAPMQSYSGLQGVLTMAIELVYKHLTDEEHNPNCKHYKKGLSPELDEMVSRANFNVEDNKTPYWHLVDWFFDSGMIFEAIFTQRRAVPTLKDLGAIMSHPDITNAYPEFHDGQPATEMISRTIRDAIARFPIVSGVTQLDASDARVCIFDVKEIIKTPSGPDDFVTLQSNAICYLTMMNALLRDFFFDEASVSEVTSGRAREYHLARARALTATEKLVVFDEKHVLKGAPGADEQLDYIIATGRKLKIGVLIGSQVLDDASEKSKELATSVMFCGAGEGRGVSKAAATFEMGDHCQRILKNISPPSNKGAEMLMKNRTRTSSDQYQHLYLSLGPNMLWAMASESEDRYVRDAVYRELDPKIGRSKLAKAYPGGSIKARLTSILESSDGLSSKEKGREILDNLVEDICNTPL